MLIAQGSSTINFLRQLGGAVGIGLVGNVLEWRLRAHAARAARRLPRDLRARRCHHRAAPIVAAWHDGPAASRNAGAAQARDPHESRPRPSSRALRRDRRRRRSRRQRGGADRWRAPAASVVLVDAHAFPRDKVCGDGLIPDAHRALDRLGVLDAGDGRGAQRDDARLHRAARRPDRCPGRLAVLPRKRLDEIVCRAAVDAGARMFAPAALRRAAARRRRAGRVVGADSQHGERDARDRGRWLVLASGAQPQATIAAGLCERRTPSGIALRGYVENAAMTPRITSLEVVWHKRLSPGYGWIFPCGDDLFNIGVGVAQSHRAGKDGRARVRDVNLREVFAAFKSLYAPARELVEGGRWHGEPGHELKGAPLRCSLEGARLEAPGVLVTRRGRGQHLRLHRRGHRQGDGDRRCMRPRRSSAAPPTTRATRRTPRCAPTTRRASSR